MGLGSSIGLGSRSTGEASSSSRSLKSSSGRPSACPTAVVEQRDAHGDGDQEQDRTGEQQEVDRVAGGRGHGGEQHHPEDDPSPPAQQLPAGEDAGEVQQHEHEGHQEADPEHQHRAQEEGQVAVDRDDVLDVLGREAEQDLQAERQHGVGQCHAREEQGRRDGDEREGPTALVAVQAGGDEPPQLVQPDRRRQHDPRHRGDLHLEDERVGDAGQGEGDLTPLGAGLLDCAAERRAQPGEQLGVVDPADDHADADRNAGLDQP